MTKIVFLLSLLCLSARSSHAQGTVVIGTSCSPSGLSSNSRDSGAKRHKFELAQFLARAYISKHGD